MCLCSWISDLHFINTVIQLKLKPHYLLTELLLTHQVHTVLMFHVWLSIATIPWPILSKRYCLPLLNIFVSHYSLLWGCGPVKVWVKWYHQFHVCKTGTELNVFLCVLRILNSGYITFKCILFIAIGRWIAIGQEAGQGLLRALGDIL